MEDLDKVVAQAEALKQMVVEEVVQRGKVTRPDYDAFAHATFGARYGTGMRQVVQPLTNLEPIYRQFLLDYNFITISHTSNSHNCDTGMKTCNSG